MFPSAAKLHSYKRGPTLAQADNKHKHLGRHKVSSQCNAPLENALLLYLIKDNSHIATPRAIKELRSFSNDKLTNTPGPFQALDLITL